MDEKTKNKGRAISALRNALREAREDLIKADMHREAESCPKAIRKSERVERG